MAILLVWGAIITLVIYALIAVVRGGSDSNRVVLNPGTLTVHTDEEKKKVVVSSTNNGYLIIVKEYPYENEEDMNFYQVCASKLVEKLTESYESKS